MKQLRCEMCGSSDLIKQDGVFVCQSCGCKYSVEEAKKMMVEIEGKVDVSGSTVRVDSSEKLNNLLLLAKRARDEGNAEEAKKYYEMALIEDPNNWEPAFYSQYYKLEETKVVDLHKNLAQFSTRALTTIDLIIQDKTTAKEKVQDMILSTAKIGLLLSKYVVDAYTKQAEEYKVKMLEDVSRSLTTSGYKSRLTEISEYYKKEDAKLLSITEGLRALLLALYCKTVPHIDSVGRKETEDIVHICDLVYQTDINMIQRLACDNPIWQSFAKDLVQFELTVKNEMPEFSSESLPIFRKLVKDKKDSETSKLNKDRFQAIISIIENEYDKVIKEEEEKKRKENIEKYWNEHKSEKEALEHERKVLEESNLALGRQKETLFKVNNPKIQKLNQEKLVATQSESAVEEKEKLDIELCMKRNSLGIFKGKEKKALTDKINAIRKEIYELKEKAKEERREKNNAFDEKIKELQKESTEIGEEIEKNKARIAYIQKELTKDR